MFPRLRSLSLFVFAVATFLALPALAQAPPAQTPRTPRPIPGELLVKFRPTAGNADRASVRALVRAQALRDFSFIRVEHWKLEGMSTQQAIDRLRNNPHIEYSEPNYEVHADVIPNDPRFSELYGLRNTGQTGGTAGADIKAASAWDLFIGDPNLKVGVIDTGVDYNHPDLAANVWTNPGEIPANLLDDDNNGFVDDVHGYDFVNNDGDSFDDNGHGTHVSGTIAAVGNNNVGVVGVNWQAKVVGIKFLNASGSGSTAGAISGIQYAITIGVRLTSNSWGGGGFSQALLDAINASGAAGQLFVAAAGNSAQNTDVTPSYPASYNSPYIISVAATDHNDNLASFSNYGATTVDLAAPGVSILSCQPGGGYQLLSGTSMATPHVSGVAALAMGRFPNATNLFIKNLILSRADPKAQLAGKVLTGGRLNALLAISDPDETPPGGVSDLAVTETGSSHARIGWTATGDDGATGRAATYEIRYSSSPITDLTSFLAGTPASSPDPQTAGSAETLEIGGLAFNTGYYFALRVFDEFGNVGPLSNVATGTTLGTPDLTASPGSFSATLLTGAATSQTLTIGNAGQGTLDFSIPTPELQFTQPVMYDYVPLAKGEDDVRIGLPGINGSGGPDGFGYRWVDSNHPNGPAFSWTDITGVGTQLALTGDDANAGPVAIGFDFPFYGATFNSVRICTNGWLSFTDTGTAYDNQPLPNAGAPVNLVAPFWDDLDFGTTPRVYTYNDGTRFIVSWEGTPHYQSGGPYTFQAILYTTGEMRFQYLSMGSLTNSATVGIQNAARTIGLTTAFNANYVANNLAVRIVPLSQWLTVSPASGRVAAGNSQDLQVHINALGLDGGVFSGNVVIHSNDPDENPTSLPAELHVIGAPDIALSPATVDFGTFFVGANPTRNLLVTNPGTDVLEVTNITSSDPDVHPDATVFSLAPHGARNVVLTFSPATARTLSGTVTVASNDPDSPTASVSVIGQSTPAPAFSVSPEQLAASLLTNTATSQTLRVSNSGGSPYVFTAEAQVATPSGSVIVYGDADNVDLPKDAPDVQFGPAPLRAGGPDVFGYTYQDSDEPSGPVFSWADISATGTAIPFNGDDQNLGPFPVGFGFPYYGTIFSSFRLCTNGWLTFTSTNTQTTFTNTSLPNSGSSVPPNLLAVFWDDLDYRLAQAPNARAYYQYDGTKLIIQFKAVPRRLESGTTATNDFEILIFPNGTIVYQYLTMNAVTKNSATIGMQNAARNDGLQVVFNANYVKNNLAIRFRPPAKFLTVSPAGGTVPAGNFLDLTVGFNAAGLFGGTYNGQIHIVGNDPVLPQKDVPCVLTVTGVPDIAANPAAIDFGNVFIGFPQLRQLTVNNIGTDDLVVTNVTSSDAAYGVDVTNFTVPPLGNAVLFVTFNPAGAAGYPAMLTLESNDPDTPGKTVTLAGAGLVPPDVGTDPTSIATTLNIPATSSQMLTVHNTGGSDLNFVVGTNLTANSVTVYQELVLGKEEPDPRPGILGSGGPDVFGYTWSDSDDPGGPAFDWVDITAIGIPITLPGTGDDVNVPGIPIGFTFPFYGNNFTTVNVCSNGWLSFTSTATSLTNQPLPNSGSGVPENLVAAFWDDLDPDVTPTRLYRYSDGTRFILSYVGVPRFSSGGPYTFQVILYPSGRIVYQYLDMQGTRLNEATIGIQNAARNDGLTVVHNAAYMHNNLAIEFRTVPEYMTVTPTSGTIAAGQSAQLAVSFDTEGLFGGLYQGSIRIASNDPDEGVVLVPTALTAMGVPNIATVPASLDFGSVYVGLSADRTLQVRNIGTDVLTVTGFGGLGSSRYALVGASFPIALGQNGSADLTVRFTPTTTWVPPNPCLPPQVVASTLSLESNDPDGNLAVPLTGVAVIPPEIGVSPGSMPTALATTLGPSAIMRTKTLVINNTGCSDLAWSAQALSALPASIEGPTSEGSKDDPGAPGALGGGGPDAFGYRWLDSDDPLGPAFGWVDITGVGTPIPFTGDDQNQGPFPLPFPFTFYGSTFNSFRACTNGWISFTSTATTFTNTALPSGGTTAPVNLIAPFWDDLTFSSTGDVYYHYDGEKLIISYVAVPRLTSGGPYTFQILLYPSGTIDFQYLDMQGTRLNEATVGIQNATRDVGLQVVFNAAYVKNNLRVRITNQPGWLTINPPSGVVPAGGQGVVNVVFNATGLADGDYTGQVRVQGNDLDEPLTTLPCGLHVGVVGASFDMDPNSLNRASNGNWVKGVVELPAGMNPHLIRPSSVLVQRTVPVDPAAPLSYADEDSDGLEEANYKFGRTDVAAVLPTGDAVPVEVVGEVEDVSWFAGTDVIRVLPPVMSLAGPLHFTAGTQVQLVWENQPGHNASYYDLWFSSNAGESWNLLAGGLTNQSYLWTVPSTPTQTGRLEVVAVDARGAMGSWISDPLEIVGGVTAVGDERPTSFGLRMLSANPAPGRARLELAMPEQASVDVRIYDARGRLVRRLATGSYEPGRHVLDWDARDESGAAQGSGIYFAKLAVSGRTYRVRLALMK